MPINILRNRLAWMKAKHLMPIMRSNRFAIRRVFNSFYPYLNGSDVQNGRAGRRSSVIKIVDRVRVHDGRFVFLCRFYADSGVRAAEQNDRRCRQIGISLLFAEDEENPFPWMSEMIDLKKERNFFETRVIEYQTGGALNWD